MTEQHGPEADAWMVNHPSGKGGLFTSKVCACVASADGGECVPLYAVRPKRLEWERLREWGWIANTPMGYFEIEAGDGHVFYAGNEYAELDHAKAAAQADYDRRAWACFESL